MADKDSVASLVNRVVMPGDVIGKVADLEATIEGKSKIKFGPGLREENGVILAYKAGVLRHRKPATYLIDCNQRRVRLVLHMAHVIDLEGAEFLQRLSCGRYAC